MKDIVRSAYRHPLLIGEDLERLVAAHHRCEVEKGKVLIPEGQVAGEYYILQSGLIRAFVHDYEGSEITTEFFVAGEIAIVPDSLFQRRPSKETLVAATNSVLWKISFDDFQLLFHQVPGFSEWGRLWFTQQLFAMKQRSLEMITAKATDRYLRLVTEKPQIIQHVPLKQIASFLGITDTSLSRIRKEISQ